MTCYVGIDIGGTNVKYGLIDNKGIVLEKGIRKTSKKLTDLLNDIAIIVSEYQEKQMITGVGISVPGIVRKDGFMVTGGALFDLYGVHLKELLTEKLQLPVAVENDANCAALAEKWQGAGVGLENFISMVVGTGVGGAIVIHDRLYRGANATAGEFGFMLSEPIRAGDTRMASLSLTGSVQSGVVNRYSAMTKEENLDGLTVFKKAVAGDEIARITIETFYVRLSEGLYNLSVSFDPEAILIGGAISSDDNFIAELNKRMNAIKLGHPDMVQVKLPPIIPCYFRNDAGIVGSVYKVLEEL